MHTAAATAMHYLAAYSPSRRAKIQGYVNAWRAHVAKYAGRLDLELDDRVVACVVDGGNTVVIARGDTVPAHRRLHAVAACGTAAEIRVFIDAELVAIARA
jgi:hypothetical protein